MTLRPLVPLLAVTAAAPAQQPALEVQDLLRGEATWSRWGEGHRVHRLRWWGNAVVQHLVSGEGHLAAALPPWDPRHGRGFREHRALPPRTFFSEESLAAVLTALREADDPVRFARIGERVLVQSDYPEQAEVALGAIRAALPPRLSLDVRLERVADGRTTVLLAGIERFTNGEVLALGDVEDTAVVADLESEIAAAAASANPVVFALTHGASLVLRARPMPFRDAAVVEVVARTAAPTDAPPMPDGGVLGAPDRIATRFDEAGFSFRLERDQPVQHEWTALDGALLRITCRAAWTPRPLPEDPRILISPLFDAPVLGFRTSLAPEPEEYRECVPAAALLAHVLQPHDDAVGTLVAAGEPGGGVLVLRGETGRRIASRLAAGLDRLLQPVRVAVEALDVPADAAIAPDGPVPGAVPLARLAGPGLIGLPACFASACDRSYLRDWDTEVAQGSRIADPKVGLCEEGWFATAKVLATPPAGPRRLELALDVVRFVELRSRSLAINSDAIGATEQGALRLPREVVPIEQPVLRGHSIATVLDLDGEGRAVLERSGLGLLGADRKLVVRVRVDAD